MNETKIVTIGGGTGAPVILHALVDAGFNNIDAICTAMDSGGRTGVIRSDERDQVIAVSDLLRNLLALISPENNCLSNVAAFTEITSFTDGRNRNLGYTIYYALLEKFENDYLQVQRLLEELLNIQFAGRALPVTLKSATLCFQTEDGVVHCGEHELDRYSMSQDMIGKVWIEPLVSAAPDAIESIRQATHIIFCPGSIYGSVIVNLLPKGINNVLKKTTAKKILITNLVSTRNETHDFTPLDYWRLFQEYTDLESPFDIMVVPDLSRESFEKRHRKAAAHYAKEYSYFLGWTTEELEQIEGKGVEVKQDKNYSLTPKLNRLRHDSDKLARILKDLIV